MSNAREIVGQRVSFKVKAHDGVDLIGEGRHERFVVDVGQVQCARSRRKPRKLAEVA